MENVKIPRVEIATFTETNFTATLLKVEQYPLHSGDFVIKNRESYPIADYISPNRRQFFKIFHMTSGTGILTVGLHQYNMSAGDIAFLHPDQIMSWQTTSAATGGHFCLIHPRYFDHSLHVLQLLNQYPYFNPSQAVIQLTASRSARINRYFELILNEEEGDSIDKKQAILLHLQLILLEAKRAGKKLNDVAVADNYRYVHGFLALLESSFQVQGPNSVIEIKTASEFAEQLHVHPNYLNTLVKTQTGKTLREHIQERLLHEAKILLVHTDWDIRVISQALGFSEQAAFTAFFKKMENCTPSVFRSSTYFPANI